MSAPSAAAELFTKFSLRGMTLKNRLVMSPMCMYSAKDGFATKFHLVHYGTRAIGGTGLIMMEATGVVPQGRITPHCLGIWKDDHIQMLKEIVEFVHDNGAKIGIQLQHAGNLSQKTIVKKLILINTTVCFTR